MCEWIHTFSKLFQGVKEQKTSEDSAWQASLLGWKRVRHNLATKQQIVMISLKKKTTTKKWIL